MQQPLQSGNIIKLNGCSFASKEKGMKYTVNKVEAKYLAYAYKIRFGIFN
jgi:hypothetical protein